MTSPLVTYLVSYRKILAVLCAPTDSAVQAFIHITVPLIWPVPAIISPIAEIPFRDAAPIGAHEEGAIAQASWKEQDMTVTGTMPCNFSTKLGNVFDLTMDHDRLIPFKKALLVIAPYVPASFLGECCYWWRWWRDSSWEPSSSLTCCQTF